MLVERQITQDRMGMEVTALGKRGIRSLAVARTKLGDESLTKWEAVGMLSFLDPPRPDTK